ncbi:MAG: calcium:proton antiporter, partial [Betaproteobacteria bacterium]
REWPLLPIYATAAAFFVFDEALLGGRSSLAWTVLLLAWLLAVMLASAFAVVRHAESLAAILGEPFGTLILTFAITAIEVMLIAAVMLTGPPVSTLARDTMFAVVMIVFNGMVGLSLLLGGLRYHEQTYNLQGANAFLAVILPLAVLGLVLPNFTTAPGQTFSTLHEAFLMLMSLALYGAFLGIQTLRHRRYFTEPEETVEAFDRDALDLRPAAWHGTLLVLYIVPIVLLSKKAAVPIEHAVRSLNAPAALVGFLVAALVLSPESLGAVRAALANQLQRSINLLLGSVLASISLTIPAVLAIGFFTGRSIVLGLDSLDVVLLVLTLGLSAVTFSSGRTNILLGAVHLVLFCAYVILMFDR